MRINYKKILEHWQVCSCYDPDEKRTLYFVQPRNTIISEEDKNLPGLEMMSCSIAHSVIAHELHVSKYNLLPVKIGSLYESEGILLKSLKIDKFNTRVGYTYRKSKYDLMESIWDKYRRMAKTMENRLESNSQK